MISSRLDARSLVSLYLEANSEDAFFTLAEAEADFETFSSQHLKPTSTTQDSTAQPRQLAGAAKGSSAGAPLVMESRGWLTRGKEGKRFLKIPPSSWEDTR